MKTINNLLMRNVSEEINTIINSVGEKLKKKNATDIVEFIIRDYAFQVANTESLQKRIAYQSDKISSQTNELLLLTHKLERAKSILLSN